jgi:hypothetical protein
MLPGVQSVTAVARDPMALVGSEKNTVYGIDLPSFRKTAYLPDSFFVDGNAQQTIDAINNHTNKYAPGSAKEVLDALANTPDGIIISVEQAERYNIFVGDPVLLRLYNHSRIVCLFPHLGLRLGFHFEARLYDHQLGQPRHGLLPPQNNWFTCDD